MRKSLPAQILHAVIGTVKPRMRESTLPPAEIMMPIMRRKRDSEKGNPKTCSHCLVLAERRVTHVQWRVRVLLRKPDHVLARIG